MSETQNALCTCSLREEHYHITEVMQKTFYASHIASLSGMYILSNILYPRQSFTISLLPKVTMVQPQDPVCKFLNVTYIWLWLSSILSLEFFLNILGSLSGLYKYCSFFKI